MTKTRPNYNLSIHKRGNLSIFDCEHLLMEALGIRAVRIFDGFAWWVMSRRRRIGSLHVGAWDGDHDAELFSKVSEALALLEAHDPLRFARALWDLKRIWVLLLPGPQGSFHVETWCCRLDSRFVLLSQAEAIASVIVHEATHARLFRRGIDYRENLRSRVEAVCLRQQAVFATKIPQGKDLRSEIQACSQLKPSNWTNTALERKHLRGSIEALRDLGTPDWFVNIVFRLYRRRQRRQRHRTT